MAGQPAPGEKEAWNADALMEGVRVGTGRGDFLAALEDRVKAQETQWAPLLQLHFPHQLDDYPNKVLVETEQRFFKKEPMDVPGYSDMAAKRRELLPQRLEARKSIGVDRLRGQAGLGRTEELQQKVRTAEEQLGGTSASLKAIRLRLRRQIRGGAPAGLEETGSGGHVSMEPVVGWSTMGSQEEGLQGVVGGFPRRRRGRTSGPSQERKEALKRRFLKAGQGGGLKLATSRSGRSSMREW